MTNEHWKTGIELELMSPVGSSRRHLAHALAEEYSGRVVEFFHPEAEHSISTHNPVFQNLTQGFRVIDSDGLPVADLVDDLTLQQDLNKKKPPIPDWYRIVSNDARLLSLVQAQCDAADRGKALLLPIAQIYGTEPVNKEGMIRISDKAGSPIAMLAPLPGERERPCEVVLAPIKCNLTDKLTVILTQANALGFTLASEAATHFHFDASRLLSGRVIARLIRFFHHFSSQLRIRFNTNPLNRRLGAMPKTLVELSSNEQFIDADWNVAHQMLKNCEQSKFQEINFLNIAKENLEKHTLEVRMIGPSMDVEWLVTQFFYVEKVLEWAIGNETMPLKANEL